MIFGNVLEKVVRGFSLVDVCESVPPRAVLAHYTSHGASRLNGIYTYVKSNISGQKLGVKTVFAAFTDHLAVYLRITLETPQLQRGLSLRKIKTKHLEDTIISCRFQQEWTRWRLQEGKYPNMVTW
jgi:hypothetical protein